MKVSDLTVTVIITNKEKLTSITDNIIKLANLAKDNPNLIPEDLENICANITKDFKGLLKPKIKPEPLTQCTGCIDKLEGILYEILYCEDCDPSYKKGVELSINKLIKLRDDETLKQINQKRGGEWTKIQEN